MENPLKKLQELGQSPWHDNIRRSLITSGALKKMIRHQDITGLTSNPTIFEQAIVESSDYDDAMERLALKGKNAEEIFDALAIEDISQAADLFLPVYKRTNGADGYVSIEVSPKYARDTKATIQEARRLWKAVGRPNLMIKIPATPEGLPAIEECIAGGVNVNVTLIFSLERYDAVMEAYIKGLVRRRAAHQPLGRIASVASFFVSRVDTLVDKLLDGKLQTVNSDTATMLTNLKGKAAIANAKLAYAQFRRKFSSDRFVELARYGARIQRPLWASTSTKNPAYPDVYYIEALIGPDTVDTIPPATLVAYKDHGRPEVRLPLNLEEASSCLEQLAKLGISMNEVTRKLESDGVAAFATSFDTLLTAVEARRQAILINQRQIMKLGKAQKMVVAATSQMAEAKVGPRLWKLDSKLWKPEDPDHQAEIRIRLGWLEVIDLMLSKIEVMTAFADQIRHAGFTHALLCGMGGSSLAPEVLRSAFGVAKGFLDLAILDSTDPAAVLQAEQRSKPGQTLYIIASKSGSTTEPTAFFQHFWKKVTQVKPGQAGENFIAITDPGTPMERMARKHNFRQVFLNPPEIGGRYAALSYFGLVPAALMGIHIGKLLERAKRMQLACGPTVAAAHNPGLALGAVLGALAGAGRNKMTLLLSKRLSAMGCWIEQLIAESTGKEGVGIVPIESEPTLNPKKYGRDRLFVHMYLGKDRARWIPGLVRAGLPLLELQLFDLYDLGAEFLRWEIATAAAGWMMKINPFDQPNIQESKDNTKRLLAECSASGCLPESDALPVSAGTEFSQRLLRHLRSCRASDYVALTAYVKRTPLRDKLLQQLRDAIGQRYNLATTAGYGPRFLHSTGQLHKGGANNAVILQFICQDHEDMPVPGEAYTFGILKAAQALGDYQSLVLKNRRVLRIQLGMNVEAGFKAVLAAIPLKTKRR